ncbi:telomere repeat-binding factor 4-like [Andrographis paniculata]|uniref:telomere repeat-binding factor 4-like n=1 Tax=Andrographis paniculata TaxID=175694 RepID=UPI0021E8592A|nr:telomere repeat-binding factor 4-like [Andrographis paniculata]
MGNPKQKWTSEEEEALRAGVAKHGAGKWKNIQRDPEFNHLLFARSNIDLKDKWRNLSVANGQGSRDKAKIQKVKTDGPATPLPVAQVTTPVASSSQTTPVDVVMSDSSKSLPEGNNAAKYNSMIYEALSTLKEPNGSDASAIATYIEQRQDVPPNFKRLLSSRLRRLVQQEKLEKVHNCYKIKRDNPHIDPRSLPTRQKDTRPRQVQGIGSLGDTLEDAAVAAAYRIAEAENKSFVAAEAVKEVERVSKLAEDMEALLQFATYCHEQCASGEKILLRM